MDRAVLTQEEKVALTRRRAWNGPWVKLSGKVARYPTMLSPEELRMLHWLARDYFAGEGVICDLGSFLGGSTAALASGLQAAGRSGRLVHSYDRHTTKPRAWRRFRPAGGPKYPADGNFLPLMVSMLGELGALVEIHSGDFPGQPVPEEGIEILFVDIAKSVEVNDHVVAEYFPRLIPGRSIVVQQDYFHYWPYWDVVVMEILAEHFTPLACCEANSALFLSTKAVDAAAVERALFRNHDLEASKAAIRAAGRRWEFSGQRARLLAMLRALETFDALPTTIRPFREAYKGVLGGITDPRELERAF